MMKLYNLFKLYKKNIYKNIIFIIICFVTISLFIGGDSFFITKRNDMKIYDLQLLYSNLNLNKLWLYISLCSIITLKMLSFADDYIYILKIGSKEKLWMLIGENILITNFMLSLYLVIFSYVCGLLFSKQIYMNVSNTLILLIVLVLLYTIGFSLFNILILIVKTITGNKNIAYLVLVAILVTESLNGIDSLVLYDISFNMGYLNNITSAFSNILKLGGITIILFELAGFFYKKEDIYNTKSKLMGGAYYENQN